MTFRKIRKNFINFAIFTCVSILFFIAVFNVTSIFLVKCESNIIFTKNFKDFPRNKLNSETIYFLETHNSTDHQITAREACAIESAALINPNSSVVVLFLTPTDHIRLTNSNDFQSILSYRNIYIRYLNTLDLTKGTLLEKWMDKKLLQNSKYAVGHTSDILRIALLYKYSGIYLDLDTITIKPLNELNATSFACDGKEGSLINNGILKFSENPQKELLEIMLEEVVNSYDSSDWIANGPTLLTKSIKKFCNVSSLKGIYECKNFNILSMDLCFPVRWEEWYKLFKESYANEAMEKIKKSYFVHLWNSTSKGRKIGKFNDAALNRIAAQYCPNVYESNVQEI